VKIAVRLEPATEAPPPSVAYTWDPDTEILSAQLAPIPGADGMSGSVGLEGKDGSWVILDVAKGHIKGVEIAVWPEVRKISALAPPTQIQDARVVVPARQSQPNIASLESSTHLIAEADSAQRNFHFRLGKPREARTIRLARDVLLDVDDKSQISGVWLLNVPPAPVEL
jgi:hypothetical protein